MEEQLSPVAVSHLLQHTLRSLCTSDASQWVYAVFWRILPRNYPRPRWDLPGAANDRTRGNKRNWMLAWEDGFCNFAATTAACSEEGAGAQEVKQSLQPELFFKMSHDIYNYGKGVIGNVAADHSHKWVFKEQPEEETIPIFPWNNPADNQPRTWEAQFQSGIQTIALIAVREGVVQLGSMKKVAEDLTYVATLRRNFGYVESTPGVLLPHPSFARAFLPDVAPAWPGMMQPMAPPDMYIGPYGAPDAASASMHIMPSMRSLDALLAKLPPIMPAPPPRGSMTAHTSVPSKEELEEDYVNFGHGLGMSISMPSNGRDTTSTSADTSPPMSAYFVDAGGKPGEEGF